MTRLIVICGATATGKSGLALALAMRLGTVILSADSRQVYREFDIGTAKPTPLQQKLVPHYLIDICDPRETMTVADFQCLAQTLILGQEGQQVREEGEKYRNSLPLHSSPLLLVGGTGLYIKSVTRGMKIPRVAPQTELRSQFCGIPQSQLYQMLEQVDPIAAAKIHPNDSVRTIRGLEVFYVTGKPISEQQGENPPNYPILQIGLDCDLEHLTSRIAQRTEKMIADGLVKEVENLCQKYGSDLPLLETLGYQEIKQYLAGDISLEEAKELIILHTRQFAKRQRTWFHKVPDINWFDVRSPNLEEQVWLLVQEFITNCDRV